jgi:hypothetical protein
MFAHIALSILSSVQAVVSPGPAQTIPPLPLPDTSIAEEVDPGELTANENCPVPRPRRAERFLMLGFYDAAALADHSIAGLGTETSTGEIRVEPGPGNLFLVLTAHDPIIYRFTGHVGRLSRLVVLAPRGAGVTGVDPGKISFGMGEDCSLGNRPSIAVKFKFAEAVFGRNPDAYEEGQLYVWTIGAGGAGKGAEPPDRDDDRTVTYLEDNFESFHPGGLVKIVPKDVVSLHAVERYELLPSTAGAVQLERNGWLVPATNDEVAAWRAKATKRYGAIMNQISVYHVYRVTEPIKLPAGLCGGKLLTLLVPSEDYVSGDPCHSEVLVTDGRMLRADQSPHIRYKEYTRPLATAVTTP